MEFNELVKSDLKCGVGLCNKKSPLAFREGLCLSDPD